MSDHSPTGAGKQAHPAPPVSPEISPLDVAAAPSDGNDIVLEEPIEEAASMPLLRDPGEPTQEKWISIT